MKERVLGEEAGEGTDGCDQECWGPCGKAGRTEWARRADWFFNHQRAAQGNAGADIPTPGRYRVWAQWYSSSLSTTLSTTFGCSAVTEGSSG